MKYRYFYHIDRGFDITEDIITMIQPEVIHPVAVQNNISKSYMMITQTDSPEHRKQFITDCQTKMAKEANVINHYVYDIQTKLREQGFPVEFFNIKNRCTHNSDNPFLEGRESFYDLSNLGNEPTEKTFNPFIEGRLINHDKITVEKAS